MPISGLVITLASDVAVARDAVDELEGHHGIELGTREGRRVAAVVETSSTDADRDVWEWIHTLPGVTFVDVAYIHFDDDGGDLRDGA